MSANKHLCSNITISGLACLFNLLIYGIAYGAPEIAPVERQEIDKNTFRLNIDNAQLDVSIRDRVLLTKKDILLDWASYSAQVVQHYYGQFPVDHVRISMEVTDGNRVRFGQAFGGQSPSLRVVVGEDISPDVLRRDWIMVHEMVHLAMANVPWKHRWWLEGLATYVESIARAQLGHLSEDFVWNGFAGRMHQGLPEAGDLGLDNTPTWGRTYWGGAIFCLLADIEIRKRSNNQKSLRDALRQIVHDGYSMQAKTNMHTVLESGDKGSGYPVLVELYEKMRNQPLPENIESLWQALGVAIHEGEMVYDEEAELAWIRQVLLKP